MSPAKWIALAILALPVAEIIVFVAVVREIGWLWALALMFATSFVGVWVLKDAGRGRVARLRVAVADGVITAAEADGPGMLTVLGGLLLVLPGFLTDVAGLALLLPPVQELLRARLRRAVERRDHAAPSAVVDLEPDQWRRLDGGNPEHNPPR